MIFSSPNSLLGLLAIKLMTIILSMSLAPPLAGPLAVRR